MNLTTILKSLSSKSTPRSSADLRRDLAAVDLAALEGRITELEKHRRALLLRGGDDELQSNTAALAAARLDAERGAALVDELNKLIGDAERREAAEAIDAQAAEARQTLARLCERQAEIDSAITNVAKLLDEIAKDCSALASANARFARAGREDLKIRYVDTLLTKQRALKTLQ